MTQEGDDRPAAAAAVESSVARDAGFTAGIAVLFLLLRLFAVVDWDWTAAAAVADSLDFAETITIAFGTLLAEPVYTGLVVMVLLPLAVLRVVWPLPGKPHASLGNLMFVVVLVACTVALLRTLEEWWLPIGAVIVLVLVAGARRIWRQGAAHRVISRVLGSIGAVAVGAALLLASVLNTPWVSLERLDTADGVVDGYVIEVQPGFVKVLTADERDVEIINTGDIRSRMILDEPE